MGLTYENMDGDGYFFCANLIVPLDAAAVRGIEDISLAVQNLCKIS